MTDRVNGPEIHSIGELELPPIHRQTLLNGARYIEINTGTQNLIQLEVFHVGGRLLEQRKGEGRATARMLKEGTTKMNSAEIAEKIDFLGASLSTGCNLDFSFMKMFSLSRYFEEVLDIGREILFNPKFPLSELSKYKKNSIQNLSVDMVKNELVSYKVLTEKMFGKDHVYGYNSTPDIYNRLTVEDLQNYHREAYCSKNRVIVASGKISDKNRAQIFEAFGSDTSTCQEAQYRTPTANNGNKRFEIDSKDKSQCAVKMGKKLFNRHHEDFFGMYVLNTVFGGYFGSRLMTELRENQGYTYNIYSGLDQMIHDGYFYVSTEVSQEYKEATIDGVRAEMKKLVAEPISVDELEMVRNYLNGTYLNSIDGPFKLAGILGLLTINNLPIDFFEKVSAYTKSVTAEELHRLANKYLTEDGFIEVVVG